MNNAMHIDKYKVGWYCHVATFGKIVVKKKAKFLGISYWKTVWTGFEFRQSWIEHTFPEQIEERYREAVVEWEDYRDAWEGKLTLKEKQAKDFGRMLKKNPPISYSKNKPIKHE